MKLEEIDWPVFKLHSRNQPIVDGNITYYSNHYYVKSTDEHKIGYRIVDDKSVNQPTLGLRRLVLKSEGTRMFPINTAIYFLADLLKLNKSKAWFIDNSGKTFRYIRSTRAKLKCCRIKKVYPGLVTGVVIELEGLAHRFKLMYHPSASMKYAGILTWGHSTVLYGLYDKEFKETYRVV